MLLLAGCHLPVSQDSLRDQSFDITVYDGTMPIKHYRAEPGSDTHTQILRLMRHHKKGWKPNFVSYAPSVVVKGDGFAINYQGYGAVYNGGLGQMHRKVTAADYQFLVGN
jgi:hypothetical protein